MFKSLTWVMIFNVLLGGLPVQAASTCDTANFEGFFLAPDGKTTVAATKQPLTWQAASNAAKASGGQLAVITDSAQNAAIFSNLSSSFTVAPQPTSKPGKKAWIDLTDPLNSPAWSVEGATPVVLPSRFSWADGFSSYSNWAAGQPDGYCTYAEMAVQQDHNCYGEPWAVINSDGTWSDEGDHGTTPTVLKGIVEWPDKTLDCVVVKTPPTAIPDPVNIDTTATGEQMCTDSGKGTLATCVPTIDGKQLCPLEDVLCTATPTCTSGGGADASGNCASAGSYGATATYSCPGGGVVSGVNCLKDSSYAATAVATCASGEVVVGTECQSLSSYSAAVSYSCPSGGTLSGSTCTLSSSYSAAISGYTCPAGGSLSGSTCTTTTTHSAAVSYSCPSGGTLSGTTCTVAGSYPATVSGYTCPSGGSLSGSTCTTSTDHAAAVSYSCPSGGTLSGSTCNVAGSYPASVASYACPSGGALSGSTCTTTTAHAATPICPPIPDNYGVGAIVFNSTKSRCEFDLFQTNYGAWGCGILDDTYAGNGQCWDPYSGTAFSLDSGSCTYISGLANLDAPNDVCFSAASFSCNAGESLSGSTCTATSSYSASPSTYSCPSGGTLSGTTCYTSTSYSAAPAYSCNSGETLSGTTCTASSTYGASPSYRCSSGGTLSGTTCDTSSVYAAAPTYSCNGGESLSGTTCTATATYGATPTYSCTAGDTLSGSMCFASVPYAATPSYSCKGSDVLMGTTCSVPGATPAVMTYSCSGSDLLSNGTCYSSSSTLADIAYSCPNGGTLSGTTCTTSTVYAASSVGFSCPGETSGTVKPADVTYTCPEGGTLDGASCTTTVKTAAIVSYTCPIGTTANGSKCVGVSQYSASTYSGCSLTVMYPWTTQAWLGLSAAPGTFVTTGWNSSDGSSILADVRCTFDNHCNVSSLIWSEEEKGPFNVNTMVSTTLSIIIMESWNGVTTTSNMQENLLASAYSGYLCPAGGSLSGTTCFTSTTTPATPVYTCFGSQTLVGMTCQSTATVPATPVYSCGAGYNLSGTTCTLSSCSQKVGETATVSGVLAQYCSANKCQSDNSGWITTNDTESGLNDKTNDGGHNADGSCNGTIYLYNGTDMRCRVRDLNGATAAWAKLAAEIALSCTGAGAALAGALGAMGAMATTVADAVINLAVNTAIDAATTGISTSSLISNGISAIAGVAGGAATSGSAPLGDMLADGVASGAISTGATSLADPAISDAIQAVGNAVSQYSPAISQGMMGQYTATKCCYPDTLSSSCTSDEIKEAKNRGNGLCHKVGRYCSSRMLSICMVEKETSCCFTSKLGRIFHEQGRPGLTSFGEDGGWGSPRSPVCRGFTPEEFQNLNFGAMDLTEYEKDMEAKMDQVQPLLQNYMDSVGQGRSQQLQNTTTVGSH